MIPPFLLKWVVGLLGPKFSKLATPLIYLVALALIAAAIVGLVKLHDHRVIANHDARQDASTARADKKADNHAAVQRQTDDARLTQEQQQLQKAVTNANTNHDRSLARARCIRLQQSARAAKRQPPACTGLDVPGRASGAH
jgi:uncharacterized protein HemX